MQKTLFFTEEGRLKMAFAVPLGLCAYFLAQWLGAWGFGAITQLLLDAWGLTEKSLPYAPAWLQTAIASYGSIEALVQGLMGYLSVCLCARFMRKRPLGLSGRHILLGAGIGFGLSGLAFMLLWLTGSVRIMDATGLNPLSEILTLLGAAAASLAPEALLGGFLLREARMRSGMRLGLFTALNALMYVLSAWWTLPSILSVAAMSLVCAMLYWKRSFWSAAAMRCFWSFGAHRILGFSVTGAPGMFFETYPVSRDWLTGGDLGLESGWLCAILFAASAVCIWKLFKNPASEERSKI